jgi:hypothetical protein
MSLSSDFSKALEDFLSRPTTAPPDRDAALRFLQAEPIRASPSELLNDVTTRMDLYRDLYNQMEGQYSITIYLFTIIMVGSIVRRTIGYSAIIT